MISDKTKNRKYQILFEKVPWYRYFGTIFEQEPSVRKSTAVLLHSVLPTSVVIAKIAKVLCSKTYIRAKILRNKTCTTILFLRDVMMFSSVCFSRIMQGERKVLA